MDEDIKYMKLALRLAEKGKASPNPMVGAVVVKGGRIVGKGYHKKAGEPHAEIVALNEAGDEARGATLYVSLEPCSHFGKTPPCTDAVINSGINRVVAAMIDPNPVNRGKGLAILKANGIATKVGVLEEEARALNQAFIKYISTGRPFVVMKVAQSLDGKIASKRGDSRWITGEAARKYVHKLRSRVDAILVGVNTIVRDDPLLTCRLGDGSAQPTKIILDSKLRTPEDAKILSKNSPGDVIFAVTKRASKKRIALFEEKGASVIVANGRDGRIDLRSLLKKLGKMGITSILIEGGGSVAASALEAGVVDKVLFFLAPKIVGGRDALTSVEGKGVEKIEQALKLRNFRVQRLAEDVLIEGYVS